ncbi:MAG: hypothetical protein E7Z84_02045 [Methanosphaera stadtmanae]|nr:hypothetical protein [Methanosphaera stadtmanae]
MNLIKDCNGFWGLLVFGNIENLILASQGAIAQVNLVILLALTLVCVVLWLLAGKFGTRIAIKYADEIEIIGGLAIVILGLQSMLQAVGIL